MYKGRRLLIVTFLAPACVLYVIFFVWPASQSLYLSLFKWSGFEAEKAYVGLGNFRELLDIIDAGFDSQFPFLHLTFRDQLFWYSVRNTLTNVFLGGVITFGLAFVLTALLSSGIRGKKFFRAVIFAPNVVAMIALSQLWGRIYNPRHGLLRNLLSMLGLEDLAATPWLGPDYVLIAALVAMCWIWVGFNLVLLLSAVEQIPQDMFDAAKVDGANTFQMFTKITIPLVWDVLSIAVINFGITALKVFEFPYIIKGLQAPKEVTTMAIRNYVVGFGRRDPIYRLGYASAIAVIMQVLVIVLILVFGRLFRRERVEYS